MYKYTIANHYKHYFKNKYYPNCRWYRNLPIEKFVSSSWPDNYMAKYWAIHFLPGIVYYSRTPVKEVPVVGYLVPSNFFKEEFINE